MKKINKNKSGFTLIEMVLVIAIIVILAVIVWFNVAEYMGKAKSATSKIEQHQSAVNTVTSAIASALT
ncbi:MAG: prepilin-type N-terminal cleavage/methylation domain-containing protein [Clostridiales bacterium]|nr:prepilin-type N-terminal cleavage/methylation domain-containing protein [Clostridiales bacterium]